MIKRKLIRQKVIDMNTEFESVTIINSCNVSGIEIKIFTDKGEVRLKKKSQGQG